MDGSGAGSEGGVPPGGQDSPCLDIGTGYSMQQYRGGYRPNRSTG